MWRRRNNTTPEVSSRPAIAQAGSDMETLMNQVCRWGLEAGFLGIDAHLEPRLAALVRETTNRKFGNYEAERDRLLSELEGLEKSYEEAVEAVAKSARSGESVKGIAKRVRAWFTGIYDYRTARDRCRQLRPQIDRAKRDYETAELRRREACEWRETATQGLRANYEFQKARAAAVRTEKEQSHDHRENRRYIENRQFIVHGAN